MGPTERLLSALLIGSRLAALPFVGVLLLAYCSSSVYVDEAGLLAGFATPQLQLSSSLPPPPPLPSCSSDASTAEQLQASFEGVDASSVIYEIHPSDNCSCASLIVTVGAKRGDGTEALLLAVEVGDEGDLADASSSRAAALSRQLAFHLHSVSWLAKDVILFLHPRCACACDQQQHSLIRRRQPPLLPASTWPACPHGPLRRFLDDYHLVGVLRDDASAGAALRAGLRVRRGGVLRQVLSLSLRSTAAAAAAGGGQASRPSALSVELGGANGRLPNFDLYSTVWKIAGDSAVRVPLTIPATATAAAADGDTAGAPGAAPSLLLWLAGASSPSTSPLLHGLLAVLSELNDQLRIEEAIGAMRFALSLAWGVPRGEHAAALTLGARERAASGRGAEGATLRSLPMVPRVVVLPPERGAAAGAAPSPSLAAGLPPRTKVPSCTPRAREADVTPRRDEVAVAASTAAIASLWPSARPPRASVASSERRMLLAPSGTGSRTRPGARPRG